MNNSEFYTPQENWPQPADDPATLLPADPPETVKKKQKKKRLRKKMSESLSGMTAAALAVVMLTTAVFDEKGGFGGGFDASPGGGGVEICPVCYDPYCNYFVDGYPGLRLSGQHNYELVPHFIYQMKGPSDYDSYYCTPEIGITTKDLKRMIFQLPRDVIWPYWEGYTIKRRDYIQDTRWGSEYSDGRGGLFFTVTDRKTGEYVGYLLAYLVYAPNGVPGYDPELPKREFGDMLPDTVQTEFRARDLTIADAQFQLYSDLGSEYLDYVEQYTVAAVVETMQRQELGDTMWFTETKDMFRRYTDMQAGGVYAEGGMSLADPEGKRLFEFDCLIKKYTLRSDDFPGEMTISVLPKINGQDWTTLLQKNLDLNEQARKTGHEVTYPLERLDTLTVNGITYDCWMYLVPDADWENYWRPDYLFVPVQEPTVVLTYDIEILSEGELAAVRKDSTDYFNEQMPYLFDRLNQISLR